MTPRSSDDTAVRLHAPRRLELKDIDLVLYRSVVTVVGIPSTVLNTHKYL